jgi:hypothetical protein
MNNFNWPLFLNLKTGLKITTWRKKTFKQDRSDIFKLFAAYYVIKCVIFLFTIFIIAKWYNNELLDFINNPNTRDKVLEIIDEQF